MGFTRRNGEEFEELEIAWELVHLRSIEKEVREQIIPPCLVDEAFVSNFRSQEREDRGSL